ncbi:MAG: response regulator [Synergistaceae bacterium]|nr:response regulator [Synergistaceae bacterium]MBQ3398987.1 response regulator [Synergistaceae bacterium]MBQ3757921.1 response regulator [Synergistaceae bacterium]MBQ4401552.1 response regulator [Synergistaceae bacterium]MBQ6115033.1 response regulator [Synergistaceae bacterium]
MAKKILLINQNAVLITGRLIPLLKSSEVECASVEPDAEKVMREKDSADVFVLLAGDFVYEFKDFLVSLKDAAAGKPLCVMGYDKEIEAIEQSIPKNMIAREFVRPIDMNTLSNALKMMLNSNDGNKEKKQILLVDDDITFLKMMQKWLGTKYRVAAARSGPQALSYLAEHTVDLILLDYEMPLMDGPKILEALRSKPKTATIPVIFLTGKNDPESVRNVMSLKPTSYLLKSMSKEEILDLLDKFL